MLYLITIIVVQSWFALTLVIAGTLSGFFLGYWTHYAIVKAKENNKLKKK